MKFLGLFLSLCVASTAFAKVDECVVENVGVNYHGAWVSFTQCLRPQDGKMRLDISQGEGERGRFTPLSSEFRTQMVQFLLNAKITGKPVLVEFNKRLEGVSYVQP